MTVKLLMAGFMVKPGVSFRWAINTMAQDRYIVTSFVAGSQIGVKYKFTDFLLAVVLLHGVS